MDIKAKLKRLFKLRFAIVYPFGIFITLFCAPSDASFNASIKYIIAGLLIRLWSNGYIIKTDKLSTNGPYAFVRHPLYIGTMLLAIGFAIMLRTSYAGLIFIAVMAIVYYQTIKKEEKLLEEKFGDNFRDYKKNVHAIIPRLTPYKGGQKWSFDLSRLMRSKEYKLVLWLSVVSIGFYIKGEFLVKHASLNPKIWTLIGIAAVLILIDIAGEIIKSFNKRRASGSNQINSKP